MVEKVKGARRPPTPPKDLNLDMIVTHDGNFITPWLQILVET
jgi:hypothetical protein